MIIGTATLAALIGAGGLGSFILLGIDRNNAALIIIGAVSSAALAGFMLEFNDRDDGTRGLKRLYGLNLNVKTMEPALRYQALEAGKNYVDSIIQELEPTTQARQKYTSPINV